LTFIEFEAQMQKKQKKHLKQWQGKQNQSIGCSHLLSIEYLHGKETKHLDQGSSTRFSRGQYLFFCGWSGGQKIITNNF
jgi:hypothetical protein